MVLVICHLKIRRRHHCLTPITLTYLCTSPYDVRLAQERFPKIHFHPLREHAGFALGSAG